jgi:hypothetical protein
MKIRKVRTLYTYKTKDGYFSKGVYSVDTQKGIPDAILQDALSGRNTVQILEYEIEPVVTAPKKVEKPQEPVFTGIDEGQDAFEGADELEGDEGAKKVAEEPEPEPEKPKKRKTIKKTKTVTKKTSK